MDTKPETVTVYGIDDFDGTPTLRGTVWTKDPDGKWSRPGCYLRLAEPCAEVQDPEAVIRRYRERIWNESGGAEEAARRCAEYAETLRGLAQMEVSRAPVGEFWPTPRGRKPHDVVAVQNDGRCADCGQPVAVFEGGRRIHAGSVPDPVERSR